ncbi:ZP domain-containing protein [Caenorhabditis elegans]|uniref:ZP domain-containing protein n=1 Tax=Caenorhabditis elegans TaxID=6239 RepID=Q21573_CAEEL|nr:ZP domain-containing protein [Caenorhabditis elegans]CAA90131.3 ZP domain-containing protein [Caenorhabditis elegans]|eukprot:NP_496293.2 CUTiclin-Like [Caenorhabditis elegans]
MIISLYLVPICVLLLLGAPKTSGAGKSASAFDNAIIGQPYISCQRDRIVIEVITERLFTGKVFVKGDYANPQCTKTFRNGVASSGGHIEDETFLGTVTKSREPYVEDHLKASRGSSDSKISNQYQNQKATSNTNFEHASKSGTDLGTKSKTFHENDINSAPDIAETFLLPRKNETTSDTDEGEWKGIGGASAGGNAIFGGTRGEELRVFGKSVTSSSTRSRPGSTLPLSTSSSPDCPPLTTCAPCACEERRTRRATNSIRLEVPLNSCNTKRDRKLNPPSVVVSLIAVVSFHDSFITKLDKAYHIQCAYAEAEKTVSTDLDVNMTDEQEINGTVEPPSCDYLISDQNGNSVQNSLVGELVRHQWVCKGGLTNKLKMLVHQCYVKDGAGQQFEVIDQHGCTLDQLMLQTPTYSEDGMSAQVDAYIFKFPDRSTVDFRCTITFCSVDDAECLDMTPPKCGANNNLLRRKKRSSHGLSSMSLHANSLTVFDIDSSKTDTNQLLPTPALLRKTFEEYERTFCVSVASFGILISASTFFATISIAVIFSYFFLRFNHKLSIDDGSSF